MFERLTLDVDAKGRCHFFQSERGRIIQEKGNGKFLVPYGGTGLGRACISLEVFVRFAHSYFFWDDIVDVVRFLISLMTAILYQMRALYAWSRVVSRFWVSTLCWTFNNSMTVLLASHALSALLERRRCWFSSFCNWATRRAKLVLLKGMTTSFLQKSRT